MSKFSDVEAAVNQLLEQRRGKQLSRIESNVLQGIWDGQSYQEMEKQFKWSPNSLKQTAHKLWSPLSEALNTKVRKGNFRSVMQGYLTRQDNIPSQQENEPSLADLDGLDCNPPGFIGREAELNQLITHIQSGCRLVVITGMSGIGKTWLSGKLARRLGGQFDHSFHRRVGDVPLLSNWYTDFSRLVGCVTDGTSGPSVEIVRLIMQSLRQRRCLLIFDQTELLQQSDDFAVFLKNNAEYGQLLKRVIDEEHRSCLVWIGQHVTNVPDLDSRVYPYPLNGLLSADAQLLQVRSLDGTEKDKQHLIQLCGGHPKLLLAGAGRINHFHNGAIAEFLQASQTSILLPSQIRAILNEILERLTKPEMALLYSLVLRPLERQNLSELATSALPMSALNDAWDSLTRRGILVRDSIGLPWGLHPLILRVHIAQRLVDELAQELLQSKSLELLHRYPVLMPSAPAYLQAQQREHVLVPLVTRLRSDCDHNEATLHAKLTSTLEQIRETTSAAPSYATSNLLTIAGHLDVSLIGCDFSGLEVRQADLRNINLRDVNCANCSFTDPVFATGLSDRLVIALHPDGVLLAVGDATGRLVMWRRVDEQLHFVGYRRFKHAVSFIEFEASGLLAVATVDNAIYLWWDQQIETIIEPRLTPTTIRSLCISPMGEYLAAGLTDGRIILWNLLADTSPSVLRCHTDAVLQLTFNQNNQHLASLSNDNKVLVWDVASQRHLREIQSSRYSDFLTLGWASDGLQIGEVYQDSVRLRLTDGTVQTLTGHTGTALFLTFNSDARYLVSSSNDYTVRVWHFRASTVTSLTGFTETPVALALSSDGRILLTNTYSRVQLWNVVDQQCLWEMSTSSGHYKGFNLQGAVGIALEMRAMLTDLGVVNVDVSLS